MIWVPTVVDSNKKKQVILTSELYNQHQAAEMLEGKSCSVTNAKLP